MTTLVELTARQASIVAWALEDMAAVFEYPDDQDPDNVPDYAVAELPVLNGRELRIYDTESRDRMLHDLLFRIRSLCADLSTEVSRGLAVAAANAANSIRSATGPKEIT